MDSEFWVNTDALDRQLTIVHEKQAVDRYVSLMKNRMKSVQSEVGILAASWQGEDFAQFKAEFNQVDDEGSSYKQMIKALESYASYLRYAAGKYKQAQIDAVNRANGLPRY